jgi:hypothetical protein
MKRRKGPLRRVEPWLADSHPETRRKQQKQSKTQTKSHTQRIRTSWYPTRYIDHIKLQICLPHWQTTGPFSSRSISVKKCAF